MHDCPPLLHLHFPIIEPFRHLPPLPPIEETRDLLHGKSGFVFGFRGDTAEFSPEKVQDPVVFGSRQNENQLICPADFQAWSCRERCPKAVQMGLGELLAESLIGSPSGGMADGAERAGLDMPLRAETRKG
jgi:hypothetical protein